jgi:[ribosomal protein S5]-alanine N-acetyltransferase
MPDRGVHLRPFREENLEHLDRLSTDATLSKPFLWFGFKSKEGFRRRWEKDGFLESDPRLLIVAQSDDSPLGWVSWREEGRLTSLGTYEIGVLLFPEHRGHGFGTEAQRLLAEYLFSTRPVHKLWAGTETTNLVEQRALERCGFVREGVLREDLFRDGAWRDTAVYGLLRTDL